ncbi:MAG: hypothetical protein ACLQDI_22940 [Syntrophobacteraceae bacterium]
MTMQLFRANGARAIMAVFESLQPESTGGTRTLRHTTVNTVCGVDPACGAAPVSRGEVSSYGQPVR